ncbi:MAG: hypothetical protein R3211_04685 [Balneolaceae bacterium]|nr:hypothetical protein [Balneolaceae bacterium]
MKTSKINPIIVLLILGSFSSFGCKENPINPPNPNPELELDTRLIGSWVNDRCTDTGGHTWTFTFEKENPRNGNGLDIKRECNGSQKIVQNIEFSWTQIEERSAIHYVCRIEKDIFYSIEGDTLFVGDNRTKYVRVN